MSPGHNNIVSDSNGLQKLKKQIKLRNQINPLPPQWRKPQFHW